MRWRESVLLWWFGIPGFAFLLLVVLDVLLHVLGRPPGVPWWAIGVPANLFGLLVVLVLTAPPLKGDASLPDD